MKKVLILFVMSLFFALAAGILAQSTNPWSAGANGVEKNIFLPTEAVYLSSYTVCFGQPNFNVYIINYKNLSNGDKLEDVRGMAQNITTNSQGFIQLTQIWNNLSAGDYNIVLDCNNNQMYDNEPIDAANAVGFSVQSIASGKVELGASNPSGIQLAYNPENIQKEATIMQILISGENEDIVLQNMNLKATGTGSKDDIEKIAVYIDSNNNGKKDADELLVGTGVFSGDTATLAINHTLKKSKGIVLGIEYRMKNFITDKTYSFTLDAIIGLDNNSKTIVNFSGLSLQSAVLTIGQPLTCVGATTISLSPTIGFINALINTKISGLTNCTGRVAVIKLNSCDDINEMCRCEINNSECSCTFTAPGTAGSYAVAGCVDKSRNTKYTEAGESAEAVVVLQKKEIANKTIVSNVTNNNPVTNTTLTPTGFAISSNNIITILSIGMVLIFIFLIIILIMIIKMAKKK